MTNSDQPKPQTTPSQKKSDPSERLAAALRENLKRRKTQSRARQQPKAGREEG